MIYTKYVLEADINRCYFCHDAKCSAACPFGLDPAALIRSIKFENSIGAARKLPKDDVCINCQMQCESACIRDDSPVSIKKILSGLRKEKLEMEVLPESAVDLSCTFVGVKLENPFLLSSSVVASTYDKIARAFDMGWAGACFKTICNYVPDEASPRYSSVSANKQFVGFKNIEQLSVNSLEEDLDIIRKLKANYPTKVVIASIMGRSEKEWSDIAVAVEKAGADIIECNFSCPNMEDGGLGVTIGQSEELIKQFTEAVRKETKIPLLVKLTPNVTDMVPLAKAAVSKGADGIATINTVKSLMGIDLDTYSSQPSVKGKSGVGGYSGRAVKPIALRFISDLTSAKELEGVPISGMGGIYTWKDAAEFIILGANHVQVTTSVMEYGYRIIDDLIEGMGLYLKEKALNSVSELEGIGSSSVVDLDQLQRNTILYPKFLRNKCIGCGRCYLSCRDGGHDAIIMKDGKPTMNPKECVGCHLCVLVCPVSAISRAKTRVDS